MRLKTDGLSFNILDMGSRQPALLFLHFYPTTSYYEKCAANRLKSYSWCLWRNKF